MTNSPRLLFFAGSSRAASFNKRLARAACEVARAKGLGATFLDLADYPMPLYDGDLETLEGPPENTRRLLAVLAEHDGVFIASPEYNASISPLLKNTIDWVSRLADDKPSGPKVMRTRVFALGAASPGGMGGIRGLVQVRYTLEMGFNALVLPDQVLVARAATAFAEDGSLADKDARDRLEAAVTKLAETARLLAPLNA